MNLVYYLKVIEWLFSYGLLYLTHEYNIDPRRPPESNIGTSALHSCQYCFLAVAYGQYCTRESNMEGHA